MIICLFLLGLAKILLKKLSRFQGWFTTGRINVGLL